ncbi:MAG: prenyltransferase/squalene oxidase repeat-containing protein [Fluviicola sp.]
MKTLFLHIIFLASPFLIHSQVRLNDLKIQLQKAEKFLYEQQNKEGFFQDSTNALFNVWESIICMKALSIDMTSSQFKTNGSLNKVFSWLKANSNSNGLICHNDKCKSSFCLETSALFLELQSKFEPEISQKRQFELIDSLQKNNGSWDVVNPDVQFDLDYPSVTAFLLNLNFNLNREFEGKEKAYDFLIHNLNPTDFWGSSWEYYGSPSYAIWQALPALSHEKSYQKTVDSLAQKISALQLENGSWDFQKNRSIHCISVELETAFILNALIRLNKKDLLPIIEKGISYLQKQQNSQGAWNGGYFPIPNQRYKKAEYLVCTALVYETFSLYLKLVEND